MPIPAGTWKANLNGTEVDLRLDPPSQTGVIAGNAVNADFRGFGDEASQRLTFALTVVFEGATPVMALFVGYLFRTPANPEPGRDVQATLSGTFQMTPSSAALPFAATGSARRNVFGWTASILEIN